MSAGDDGLDVILSWLDVNSDELLEQASADVAQAQALSKSLDRAEAHVARMREELGVEAAHSTPLELLALDDLGRPQSGSATTLQWEALRRQAEASLRSRGIDPNDVDLDALLDPDEVARIARRFIGAFAVQAHLDRYDLAIMLVAGLTAALVDWLVVNGAPTNVEQLRDFRPDKHGLTSFFRHHSVDSDNWLSHLSPAPFDQQRSASGATLPGFTPNTHRDLSLGHDPLLALVFGVRDVMNGTMTTTNQFGGFVSLAGSHAAVANPLEAVAIVVAHLLSDAFTPMGIPAPGWTLLDSLPFGSIGADHASVAKGGVDMYTRGYDSRHFLTMSTSVVAAELVLRAYWSLRCEFDEDYAEGVRNEAEIAGSDGVSDHPRYAVLAFGAHALACAANAGKVALSGGNVLLFNYPEWLRFVQVTIQLGQSRAASPTNVLIRTGLTNIEGLANGWPDIDASDPRLPTITARTAVPTGQ